MDSRVVGMTARWEMHYAQFTELRSRWTSEGGRMAPTEVRSAAADASGSPILHRRHTDSRCPPTASQIQFLAKFVTLPTEDFCDEKTYIVIFYDQHNK